MATDHKSAMEEILSVSLRSCEMSLNRVIDGVVEEEERQGNVKEEE